MKVFQAILSFILFQQTIGAGFLHRDDARVDLSNEAFCTDASQYSDKYYEEGPEQCCTTMYVPRCERKVKRVCMNVTNTICKPFAHAASGVHILRNAAASSVKIHKNPGGDGQGDGTGDGSNKDDDDGANQTVRPDNGDSGEADGDVNDVDGDGDGDGNDGGKGGEGSGNNRVDPCSELFAVIGFCKADFPSWSYNQETGKCEEFTYGGCGGNNNRFESKQECVDTCETGNKGTKAVLDTDYVDLFSCKPVDVVLSHTKQVPECQPVTSLNCETGWKVVDGKKVWSGEEDCEEVTWEECKLVDKEVPFHTVESRCGPANPPREAFSTCVNKTVDVLVPVTRVEFVQGTTCEQVTKEECVEVPYQDCSKPVRLEACSEVNVRKPKQDFMHKKKCILPSDIV